MTAFDDDELLARAARGDGDAFAHFYRRHLAAITSYLLRRPGDREVTADMTAETFAAALLACPRFRPGGAPALAWLYGIAANKLRESRRRGRVEEEARRRLAWQPQVLGVLARPRTAADAFDRRYLRSLGLHGVDLAGIRSAGLAADGTRAFVVPARGFGQQPWPARCLRGLHGRRRAMLAHPKQWREPVVYFLGGGGAGIITLAALRAHGTLGRFGNTRGRATVSGLVPNGVRSAQAQTYGRHHSRVPRFQSAAASRSPSPRSGWRVARTCCQ